MNFSWCVDKMSMEGTAEPSVSSTMSSGSQLPWHLIPQFSPGETDLTEYSRRLEFLAGIWPADFLNQLAPRAALQCKGSAFQKVVRLKPESLKTNSLDGVKLLVTTLGGVWGKTTLEDKYEKFERAIYGVSQKGDETNESYMARHEILFEDLVSQGATLSDMRAYILLRNSALASEDKKRVVIEAQGNLKYDEVTKAIRMLGARFFHEVQGHQKQVRTKTYDVNHVQEEDDQFFGDDTHYGFSVEHGDFSELAMDQFLSENDEDALIVQQFEDAILDTIQSDSEMSAFMSSYVDARRKLTEKAKFRGFWPIKSKGSGKKGKFKGSFGKGRKPLAVRIAESECRLCGQRGHWKAECPRRSQSASGSTTGGMKSQPTNMLISATDVHEEDADVFLVENLDHDEPDVFHLDQDTTPNVMHHHEHVALVCNRYLNWKPYQGSSKGNDTQFYDKVRKRLGFLCQQMSLPTIGRKPDAAKIQQSESNPSPDERSNVSPPTSVGQMPVLSKMPDASESASMTTKVSEHVSKADQAQMVLFATHQTIGILDLGASQTVMGRYQVNEFLSMLPESIRSLVFEQPVDMSFRFGNNSVVPCRVALMVPVDRFWIKIAVVETKTPFLISNNVCRSLGAVIDTTNQNIWFRELDCTMPLGLSSKRLFLIDFAELVAMRPPRLDQKGKIPPSTHENVCVCSSEEHGKTSSDATGFSTEGKSCDIDQTHPSGTMGAHEPDMNMPVFHEECGKSDSGDAGKFTCETPSSVPVPGVLSNQPTQQPDRDSSDPVPALGSHVIERSGRTFCSSSGSSEQGQQKPSAHESELRRVAEHDHLVRHRQSRHDVPRGSRKGSQILPVVPPSVGGKFQSRAPRVPVLSEHVDGTQRDRKWYRGVQEEPAAPTPASAESQWKGTWQVFDDIRTHRSRDRRGAVGSSLAERIPDATQSHGTHRSSRRYTDADCEPTAKHESDCSRGPVRLTNPAQTLMIDQVIDEYNMFMSHNGQHHKSVRSHAMPEKNWVFEEMMEFFSNHHDDPKVTRSTLDVVEVYCSADSRLTQQCQRQNLRALRFGLNQGDLSTHEGRCQLYRILKSCPKHIWMSPKCKAWCRWNQFNAQRSIEGAQKVCQAREDDEVHLLLCAALFRLQAMRGDSFHFHLEQPAGSQMLSQDCLHEIMDNSHSVRCDMCVAGKLSHPNLGLLMQKGTLITTTSSIMARFIEQFRCSHDHQHAQVAGSYVHKDGKHHRLSEYTELYTSLFCQRIVRTICASLKVCEPSTACNGLVLGTMEEESLESAAKRRRLSSKVTNPSGYPPAAIPSTGPAESLPRGSDQMVPSEPVTAADPIKQILERAMQEAPRVGKLVLERGALFDLIQQTYPDHVIRVVELCKGTDRFRKPPIQLVPLEAPLRMTLGIHRQSLEPLSETWVNWEKQSNRQMRIKSQPARLLVTVFARDKGGIKRDQLEPSATADDKFPETPVIKRAKETDERPSSAVPENSTENMNKQLQQSIIQHGSKFLALPLTYRQWISKLHHNLGHPSNRKLQNVLQQQNVDPAIVQGVEDFRCSTCVELQEPRISRPASLPEPREFNDCVGCDLVTWTSKNGKQFQFLHMIDVATNFQLAAPVFRTDAEALFESMQDFWFQWAGPCQQLVVDNMSPICSDQFAALAQGQNIHLRIIAAYAHWQNRKTERHGDIIQHMLEKFDVDKEISTDAEFRQALRLCCQAKNSMARAKGYTPEILVLGKSRKLPGGICEDILDPAKYLADAENPEGLAFRKHLELREAARKAFVQTDNSDRLRRAFLRRQRPH